MKRLLLADVGIRSVFVGSRSQSFGSVFLDIYFYTIDSESGPCTGFPKNQIMVRKFLRFGSGSGRAQPGSNTPDNFCVDLLYILLERIGFSQSQGQSEFLFY